MQAVDGRVDNLSRIIRCSQECDGLARKPVELSERVRLSFGCPFESDVASSACGYFTVNEKTPHCDYCRSSLSILLGTVWRLQHGVTSTSNGKTPHCDFCRHTVLDSLLIRGSLQRRDTSLVLQVIGSNPIFLPKGGE